VDLRHFKGSKQSAEGRKQTSEGSPQARGGRDHFTLFGENPALTHHAAELRGRVALLIVTSMRSAAMLSF
jgi:hypothetical protein